MKTEKEIEAPAEARNNASNLVLPASILAAALIIAGSIIYLVKSGAPAQAPNQNQGLAQAGAALPAQKPELNQSDVVLGSASAPVTVIEYGDYQCPFCERFFSQVEPVLKQNYIDAGKVKFVFRNFAFLGHESSAAAEAVYCAKEQNRFWAYHDALYAAKGRDAGGENDGLFSTSTLAKYAADLNLNVGAFSACLGSGKYAGQINKDNQAAAAAGVNSTPTTFVNGGMVVDASGRSVGADSVSILQAVDKAVSGK